MTSILRYYVSHHYGIRSKLIRRYPVVLPMIIEAYLFRGRGQLMGGGGVKLMLCLLIRSTNLLGR
jgi:hypothetical protein